MLQDDPPSRFRFAQRNGPSEGEQAGAKLARFAIQCRMKRAALNAH